ncbi:MAG: nucleotidyltransferase family protein [Rhodobacter sp.]|nr:nucleotidyltransferase family protein [Rhodobacter sp.]
MRPVTILVLAAGASSRMRGADKLLQMVDGVALLRRQVQAALDTGAPVLVALPTDRPVRRAALDGLAVNTIEVSDADAGMSASIRAGVAALSAATRGVAILPADMPELTTQDLAAVLAAFADAGGAVVRATSAAGDAGHPVVFPARLFDALKDLHGDQGARALLRDEAIVLVALPARHATTDLDTPEDWAAWHAARQT